MSSEINLGGGITRPRPPRPWFTAAPRNFTIEWGLHLAGAFRPADPAKGERQLGRFILPPFQRPAVWSRAQQIRLIESIWLGLPIGGFVFNDDSGLEDFALADWLLDGQQRWAAIYAYVAGEFPVYDLVYAELVPRDRRRFNSAVFPALATQFDTAEACRDIYDRLAYGGTAHAPPTGPAR